MVLSRLRAHFAPALLWVAVCVPPLSPLPISEQHAYDELRLADGTLRPANLEPFTASLRLDSQRVGRFVQNFKALSGGVELDRRPRVLTLEEQQRIHAGIRQRATALRMFLQDYYSGRRSFLAAGLIEPEVLARIVARVGEAGFQGRVNPDDIAFLYGPDILRAPDGRFYVIEDNPGYLGGMADLLLSRSQYLEFLPEMRDALPLALSPERFYGDLIESWRRQSKPAGGRIVMVTHSEESEQKRLASILAERGQVAWVSPNSAARLEIDGTGVWYKANAYSGRERVGFVFAYGEYRYLDNTDPASREGSLLWDRVTGTNGVAYWESKSHRGLVEAVLSGRVGSSLTPGVEFIGDKEFHIAVDSLVRFYLGEEPLLPSIEARSFTVRGVSGAQELNRELFDQVFTGDGHKNYVIKVADGRGGKAWGKNVAGVYVGPKMSSTEVQEARAAVLSNPGAWIVQPYFPMSSYDDMIVDLRFHSAVSAGGVVISPVPISRAISAVHGNGKVNISGNGKLFAVFVEDRPEKLEPHALPEGLALPAPEVGGAWSRWWHGWLRKLGFRR